MKKRIAGILTAALIGTTVMGIVKKSTFEYAFGTF